MDALPKIDRHAETIEEALHILSEKIASPEFAGFVRQELGKGKEVQYEIIVKKSNQPGFVMNLSYALKEPRKNLWTFLRLT